MPDFLERLFSSDGFMPHGHCYLWNPSLVWLHVVSDGLTALSYTSIPFTLLYFVRRRRDLPFHWMFLCFGVFIIACGATHYLEIWTLWTPTYWLSGVVKAITAAASVPTAILLIQLVPKALAVPTPAQLREAHEALSKAHAELEQRVLARTAELTKKNEELATEIAERKRVEAAVRETEARKRAVMEAALDAIVIMDASGTITDFNPAAERTFGHTAEEAIGRPLADVLIPPGARDLHRAGLARYLETGRGDIVGKRIEVSAVRRDGSEFPAEVAVVRIGTEGPPLFTGYIRDISERRQAAESEILRRAKEAAEEANAELEAFSYSVAHDLRAPLRAINGFSAALREDWEPKLDDEAREYLGRIMAGSERMSHLIDALLGLARLSRTEPKREPVDLSALASGVVAQLRAGDPGRDVDVQIAEGLTTQGDPQLLRALLDNLLGNAWKFTNQRKSAKIEFGREDAGEGPAYFVRDNGAGFDMKHVDKLFAPFRRLHTADEFEGTGIGLATVQRIVRRHGGRIWAEGTENEGATFKFTLALGAQRALAESVGNTAKPGGGRSWMPAK